MTQTAPTYAQFIEMFPEFSTVSESAIQARLDLSAKLIDSDTWGDFYQQGVMLDVAHLSCVRALVGNTATGGIQSALGQIVSSGAAGASTSFAQFPINEKDKSEAWYSKTGYGQEFLRLRASVVPVGYMV